VNDALARLLRAIGKYSNVVWISPGNPSSQRWFEAIPAARKKWIPWGPNQPFPARVIARPENRALFLWNPMVHGASLPAIRLLKEEMRPGDRLGFLLPELARTSDAWLHELKEAGFEPMRTTRLGPSPFLTGVGLRLHVFRRSIPFKSRPSLSLIVPARNEAGTIATVLSRLSGLEKIETEIVFIEGHSTDDTWGAISRAIETYHGPMRLRAMRQPGAGKADAVAWALSRAEGKILGVLDASLATPPEAVRRFYEALCEGRGELIVGDRFRLPMEAGAMSVFGRLGNRALAKLMTRSLGQIVPDALSGTKLVGAEDYRAMVRWSARLRSGTPSDLELMLAASALDLKILPIPVAYKGRATSENHSLTDFLHLFKVLTRTPT
jgi:hypothetical protein